MQHFASFLHDVPDVIYNVWIVFQLVTEKLKQQNAVHYLTNPKGYDRSSPTTQTLSKKWLASQNEIALVCSNKANHSNVRAKIEKNYQVLNFNCI